MQYPITRETWHQAVKEAGLTLECIACNTGVSYSLVYRFSRGTRTPSDQWLAEVAALIASRRDG